MSLGERAQSILLDLFKSSNKWENHVQHQAESNCVGIESALKALEDVTDVGNIMSLLQQKLGQQENEAAVAKIRQEAFQKAYLDATVFDSMSEIFKELGKELDKAYEESTHVIPF